MHGLSQFYCLYNMLQGDRLNLSSFLVNQLHSVAASSVSRIVIRGLIIPTRSVGIELNPNDKVPDF